MNHLQADLDRNHIDVEHYSFEYTILLDGDHIFQNSLTGHVTIRFQNTGSEVINSVPFLLNRLMRYENVSDGAGRKLEISHHLLEVENFEFFQANAGIVSLAEPLEPGESVELQIAVGGRLTGYVGAGMLYTKESLDPAFTILRSEVLPFPQIAEPDWLEVRKGWKDEFDWQAAFDVPATHKAANGERVQIEERGNRSIYRYRSTRPDTFLVFAIAPYGELRVGVNRIFYLPGDEAGAKRLAQSMDRALELLAGWFGPLEEDGGLAIIEIPEGYGSQAKFPTIIQTADAFNSIDELDQLYHELSHLWNVDMYTPQSPRLEEGLATFLQSFVTVKLGGEPSLDEFMAGILSRQKRSYEKNPDLQNIAIADFGRENVTNLSYRVGALFYYELFKILGEDKFIALLRGFYDSYKDSGAGFSTLLNYYRQHVDGDAAKLVEDWLTGTTFVQQIMQ
jgi:hypothetical protein